MSGGPLDDFLPEESEPWGGAVEVDRNGLPDSQHNVEEVRLCYERRFRSPPGAGELPDPPKTKKTKKTANMFFCFFCFFWFWGGPAAHRRAEKKGCPNFVFFWFFWLFSGFFAVFILVVLVFLFFLVSLVFLVFLVFLVLGGSGSSPAGEHAGRALRELS